MELDCHLDNQQYQAVTAPIAPIYVTAGPGAGKTRVIVERIKHLVSKQGVPFNHILALTFTKNAKGIGAKLIDRIAEYGQRHGMSLQMTLFKVRTVGKRLKISAVQSAKIKKFLKMLLRVQSIGPIGSLSLSFSL